MKPEHDTRAIREVWEQLPPMARQELLDFTEFLANKYLAKPDFPSKQPPMREIQGVISKMAGSATSPLTTDEIMELTRGD